MEPKRSAQLNSQVPSKLAPLYGAAATRFNLGARGPSILAAINSVESGFGANTGPSSAGAEGPMQFIPSTFASYGVDGDADGSIDINDPADAIFAAANYLHASGAPDDWHAAILAYNHAEWYVAEVESTARRFTASGSTQSVRTLPRRRPERRRRSHARRGHPALGDAPSHFLRVGRLAWLEPDAARTARSTAPRL